MANEIIKCGDGELVAVNGDGEEIHAGDEALYEMHSASPFLYRAIVTKISPAGVTVQEVGDEDSGGILLDSSNIYKNAFPSNKIIVND